MESVHALYEITMEIVELLGKLEKGNLERDAVIITINDLILEREKVIQTLSPPYTEAEIAIGQKVVRFNVDIKKKMKLLYADVQSDMKKVKQKKELNRSYINPYGKIKTTDGMYLDSKH